MKEYSVIKEIKKLSAGDKQFEKEFIAILIRQTSEQIIQSTVCLNNADWPELKKTAHKLGSTFIILKISRAEKLTQAIRTTAGLNIETTKKEVTELIEICNTFLTELKFII